jgi:uncharacterized protein
VPILVDGHNLIGHLATPNLQDPDDEEALVRMLSAYRARTGRSVTVVFDPGDTFSLASTRQSGGVRVVFAPYGTDADAVIIRRVRQSQDRRGWLVVTSDQELASAVSRLGARVQKASDFARELEVPASAATDWREIPLTPDEVDAWLALFEDPSATDPAKAD